MVMYTATVLDAADRGATERNAPRRLSLVQHHKRGASRRGGCAAWRGTRRLEPRGTGGSGRPPQAFTVQSTSGSGVRRPLAKRRPNHRRNDSRNGAARLLGVKRRRFTHNPAAARPRQD
jgi:hypothetical protein